MFKSLFKIFKPLVSISPVGGALMAQKKARKEQKHMESMMWEQQKKASAIAAKQQKEKESALRRISLARVRSRRRSVRGGLFGETSEGGASNLLGG